MQLACPHAGHCACCTLLTVQLPGPIKPIGLSHMLWRTMCMQPLCHKARERHLPSMYPMLHLSVLVCLHGPMRGHACMGNSSCMSPAPNVYLRCLQTMYRQGRVIRKLSPRLSHTHTHTHHLCLLTCPCPLHHMPCCMQVARVDEVLSELGLVDSQHTKIGTPFIKVQSHADSASPQCWCTTCTGYLSLGYAPGSRPARVHGCMGWCCCAQHLKGQPRTREFMEHQHIFIRPCSSCLSL